MPNRLQNSTSPYLQAHADNPVDWYPWGDEAFAEARRRDVPIFLSVGYSACHWCHVMAHESFENPHVAAILNEYFVNIKVDREELPAVDALYMQATQAMTGHGGWPMSVWLDHDRAPWYAGTYFPATPSHGSPSFVQLLSGLHDAWTNDRERVRESANRIVARLSDMTQWERSSSWTRDDVSNSLDRAIDVLASQFDVVNGGFGDAPKFPPSLVLQFLFDYDGYCRVNQRERDPRVEAMVESTCERMSRGGMYDQIGGGFARYAVDSHWTVPHFEKMLYDNALLLSAYTQWFVHTGNPLAERIVRETATFMLRELRTPEGGFAAALDADSLDAESGGHREGAYYAWSLDQFTQVLGDDAQWAAEVFGVSEQGNFEDGQSVLRRDRDPQDTERLNGVIAKLFEARHQRPAPARDDKVVAAWNGMAISALARAGMVFHEPEWTEAATVAADLLVSVHLGADPQLPSRLVRVSRDGVAGLHASGVLEDQVLVARAFLDLGQVTGDLPWLELAEALLVDIKTHFVDDNTLTDTSDDVPAVTETVDHRGVDPSDNVTPSGWSSALDAAMAFAALTGKTEWRSWAEQFFDPIITLTSSHPRFTGFGATVLTRWLDGPREIALAIEPQSHFLTLSYLATAPGAVVAWNPEMDLLANRPRIDQHDTAYVCRGHVCEAPTTSLAELKSLIGVVER